MITLFKYLKSKLNEIRNIEIKKIDLILTILISFLFSLIIISGIVAILINFMIIYNDLRIFISFIFAIIFSILIFLWTYILNKSISKNKIDELFNLSLFYGIISLIFGIIIVVILIIVGVY